MYEAAWKLGLDGIVSAPYKSGPGKSWIKARYPNPPAYPRISDGTF